MYVSLDRFGRTPTADSGFIVPYPSDRNNFRNPLNNMYRPLAAMRDTNELKIIIYKLIMKKLILITLTVFSINCFSQTKNFIDQNFIEVTGKAEMEIIPNEIYLKIILNEKDFKGKEHLDEKEKSMINKLVEIGIDISKDLAVKDIASNLKNYWIKASEINSVKIFQLKVPDAKTAGSVFKELELIDISNITVERVDHSEIQNYRQQVKVEAIKAAKSKAESLTNAINQSCGKAILIQELNNHVFKAMTGHAAGVNSNIVIRGVSNLSKDKAPDIEFETIKLEYSILARFELN